jgi:RNA polymerase sigma-70 factor (ECF subfamily)
LLDEDQKSLFMTWLGQHGSSVMKVARAYALTSEERQDLAQEILLHAWRSLPKFEGKPKPATWFYRVALHTAMNWHRKDQPRRSRQQPLLEVQTVVTEGSDSGEHAQQRETVEQLYKAINQLPKADAALVLLYLDELKRRRRPRRIELQHDEQIEISFSCVVFVFVLSCFPSPNGNPNRERGSSLTLRVAIS